MYIENPLDRFQTYSVHYVMLACRTTEAAAKFASTENDATSKSLLAVNQVQNLGDPVDLGETATDLFLVLDTRRFAQFSVESLKYDVYINGLQTGASMSNLAADLQMVILDSAGISFANFMQWLLDKQLKSNYDGMVFMLRTIFVGHTADGKTETIQAETIPLHLNRMEINLDYAKGAYTLEFMPNMNFNVQKYSRFLTISTATTFNTGTGNKLGGIIQSVENELNLASLKYFNHIQEALKGVKIDGEQVTKFGRKVQYQITIPKSWETMDMSGPAAGAAIETLFTNLKAEQTKKISDQKVADQKAGLVKDSYYSAPPGIGITALLDNIFKQVPEIAKNGNFSTDQSDVRSVKFHKYIVGLTSDNDVMVVHVDVVEFEVPDLFSQQPKNQVGIAASDSKFYRDGPEPGMRIPNDFIEYDYIFTGLNKDILNFEMKIQDFQFLLASNLRIGDSVMRSVAEQGDLSETESSGANDLIFARQYDPILLPMDSELAKKNFSNYTGLLKGKNKSQDLIKESQRYTRNLSTFYAGSAITTSITIKGNPAIMHKFNMGKVLDHQVVTTGMDKSTYRNNLEKNILKSSSGKIAGGNGSFKAVSSLTERSYVCSPVYAKINVKGPNVDFKTNQPVKGGPAYTSSVLTDNYYTVFKVSNIISNGVFTQDLELYSHNVFGNNKIQKV